MSSIIIDFSRSLLEELLEKGIIQKSGIELRVREGGKGNSLLSAKDVIKAERKNAQRRKDHSFTPFELEIFKYWDEEATTIPKDCCCRSALSTKVQVDAAFELRQLSDNPEKYVQLEILNYFTACRQRKHISNGRNYSYSTLLSFLQALIRFKSKQQTPWWRSANLPEELGLDEEIINTAKKIAKEFCSRISHGDPERLWEEPKHREVLIKAASRLKQTVKENSRFSENEVLEFVLDGLEKESIGSVVFVGTLCSENTWNVIVPQYMNQIM